jgi:hypothetical protein
MAGKVSAMEQDVKLAVKLLGARLDGVSVAEAARAFRLSRARVRLLEGHLLRALGREVERVRALEAWRTRVA